MSRRILSESEVAIARVLRAYVHATTETLPTGFVHGVEAALMLGGLVDDVAACTSVGRALLAELEAHEQATKGGAS